VLDALVDELGDEGPWLLLEPTAGQGRSLCGPVADLEAYLAALDHHPRAGIFLDTCHVFAAGEPLDEPGGAIETLDRLVAVAGPGRLRLVHANDSKDVRGAAKDRHEKIGRGHIGVGAFRELLAHPATDGVPFVLETPGSRDPGDPDIPLLKALRAEVAAAPDPVAAGIPVPA
jgi:deoxyribonuclease-4